MSIFRGLRGALLLACFVVAIYRIRKVARRVWGDENESTTANRQTATRARAQHRLKRDHGLGIADQPTALNDQKQTRYTGVSGSLAARALGHELRRELRRQKGGRK